MATARELTRLLDELYRAGAAHDAGEPDHTRRRRNLEPVAAALIDVLARAANARDIVEVGTSNGYSTIWLAAVAADTGGRVLTVDTDGAAQRDAAANLAAAGLADRVELRTADGGEVLAAAGDATVDLLFLDADRTRYASWWPHPVRVLRPGGLLVADNVTSHPDEIAPLLDLVTTAPELTATVVPVGKGELLAVKQR